ncbi:MAG: alpha/beta hydrolase family protein [Patescibacteria group bacterium]
MEKKLTFNNSKGNKLIGILTDPSENKDSPVIIMCHGFSSSKDSHTCKALAEKLEKEKVASFRFDFFAHGESEGKFEDLTVSEAVDDTMQAIGFMKSLGYKKIGLFGSSFGGLSSYIVASMSPDIFILVAKAPVATYKEFPEYTKKEIVDKWKKTGYAVREGKRLRYDFYLDAMKNDANEIAHKIAVPTLILHGNMDKEVSVNQSINIAKKIQNCALEIIVGADHRFSKKEHFERLVNSIASFVIAHSK